MLIQEVQGDPDADRLTALSQFLRGRAKDTDAKPQISKQSFMKLAQELGVNVTSANLQSMLERPPLKNLLTTDSQNPDVLTFDMGDKNVAMPVDKAQDIVAKAAKSALNKRT